VRDCRTRLKLGQFFIPGFSSLRGVASPIVLTTVFLTIISSKYRVPDGKRLAGRGAVSPPPTRSHLSEGAFESHQRRLRPNVGNATPTQYDGSASQQLGMGVPFLAQATMRFEPAAKRDRPTTSVVLN